MSFGDRMRFLGGNLNQVEFGQLFHVHRNTVGLWENNVTMPQGEMFIELYDMLNANLNWRFSGEDKPYRDESS